MTTRRSQSRAARPKAEEPLDVAAEARRVAAVLRRRRCALLSSRYGLVALCPSEEAAQALRRKRPDLAVFAPGEWRALADATPEEAELIVACKRHLGGTLLSAREHAGRDGWAGLP